MYHSLRKEEEQEQDEHNRSHPSTHSSPNPSPLKSPTDSPPTSPRQPSNSPRVRPPKTTPNTSSSGANLSNSSSNITDAEFDELERGESHKLLAKGDYHHPHPHHYYSKLKDDIELKGRMSTRSSETASIDQKSHLLRGRPRRRTLWEWITGKRLAGSRVIQLNERSSRKRTDYPPNIVRNQKYHWTTFVFVVLYNQFKFFFNLYFLLVCLSQLVPMLRVTYLFTNITPLLLVLTITLSKEAYDDYKRYKRDRDANSQTYARLTPTNGFIMTPSSELHVGDVIQVNKDERVPADMILLRSGDASGGTFLRTDQLDGETDWKLRLALAVTQKLPTDEAVLGLDLDIQADAPQKDIHSFLGTLRSGNQQEPLGIEHTMWMNTVVAGHPILGVVIYTGPDTRAVMNTNTPHTKVGLVEEELNTLTKVLCAIVVALAFTLVAMKGFYGLWIVYFIRFVVLFSTIIPLSLRVNLDMGKSVYASDIANDPRIPKVIVRTSTISEELGRIHFLLSDKTGTLTKNDMELRKLHMGTVAFTLENKQDVREAVTKYLLTEHHEQGEGEAVGGGAVSPGLDVVKRKTLQVPGKTRRDISARLAEIVQGLAVCHNVTPVIEEDGCRTYQAASPDEVAIVKWTELVGVALRERDRDSITLGACDGQLQLHFDILHCFPFTSESKRMGIIVRDRSRDVITFYQKGADSVMAKIVQANDWLDEECSNMAREGLRTLVMGRKQLSREHYDSFRTALHQAQLGMQDRQRAVQGVIARYLESDLELLGLTGVEDKLQDDVKTTLESLRQAGIRTWMLTGDKVETATCIAISSRLFVRNQMVIQVQRLQDLQEASTVLGRLRNSSKAALVIDGPSLDYLVHHLGVDFWAAVVELNAVVACRCTPTQKADVARAIKAFTGQRVCCIGDGGNDVSMIQAADVGIGIVGKEGRQASLAADFSVNQFSYLTRLLLWHGRNSYKRTSKVSQFVIHRGFVIAVMQAVFSSIVYFSPIAIYQGLIAVGYTTVYTMFPVFSLVLDKDVRDDIALLYPELYKDLSRGREITFKTFFKCLMISVYQGGVIMILAVWLFERDFVHIVAITFTSLILNELLMVALEVTTWHWVMACAEVGSMLIYLASMKFLKQDFDPSFVWSIEFVWKVAAITAVSFAPLFVFKVIRRIVSPPSYAKLDE